MALRTTVDFKDPEQKAQLKLFAERNGMTMGEAINYAVDELIADPKVQSRVVNKHKKSQNKK